MKLGLNLALVLACSISMVSSAIMAEPVVFPKTEGRNLHGDMVRFPDAFTKAKFNVAIVAFEQEQQSTVDTWLDKLEGAVKERSDFAYYEFPTIKPMGRMTRWLIYKGMRGGIKDPGARSRTVTFHLEKEPFKRALGINTESDIHIFLLDREGRLIWRDAGAWSASKWRDLSARMDVSRKARRLEKK